MSTATLSTDRLELLTKAISADNGYDPSEVARVVDEAVADKNFDATCKLGACVVGHVMRFFRNCPTRMGRFMRFDFVRVMAILIGSQEEAQAFYDKTIEGSQQFGSHRNPRWALREQD